jgi:NAD(P)-dependent dehydrogenase (short-subunit alcohol dehydrogenase family)
MGLAIAKFLLRDPQSCNLVLLARSQGPLDELKSQYPKQVEVLTGDLGKFGVAQKAVETAQAAFGKLDGLILNHGRLSPVTRVGGSEVEEWRNAFDLNFFSFVDFVRRGALPPRIRALTRIRSKLLSQLFDNQGGESSSAHRELLPQRTVPGEPMVHLKLRSIILR